MKKLWLIPLGLACAYFLFNPGKLLGVICLVAAVAYFYVRLKYKQGP